MPSYGKRPKAGTRVKVDRGNDNILVPAVVTGRSGRCAGGIWVEVRFEDNKTGEFLIDWLKPSTD